MGRTEQTVMGSLLHARRESPLSEKPAGEVDVYCAHFTDMATDPSFGSKASLRNTVKSYYVG